MADFNADRIVEGCVRCLRKIKDDVSLPLRLPESMSVRFRIGTALADACKVCQPVPADQLYFFGKRKSLICDFCYEVDSHGQEKKKEKGKYYMKTDRSCGQSVRVSIENARKRERKEKRMEREGRSQKNLFRRGVVCY